MKRIRTLGRNTFASLHIRNYRLYSIGQAISLIGTWMQTVAQGLLVLELTGSGTILGTVLALQFLPILLLGPLAGVITDRYSKRKIIFCTQSAAGILALVLGFLIAFGLIEIWMVYISAVCFGLIIAFDDPSRHAFLVEMVGKNSLNNAISLNSSIRNLARIIGPLLAGVATATVGLAACFLLNAVSYIAVLIVLSLINTKELHPSKQTTRIKGQLREGFRYVKATPILRNTLLMTVIVGMLTFEFSVNLPLLAGFTFHNLTNGYALLTTAMASGALFGALFSAHRQAATPKLLILTAACFGITVLLASIAPSLAWATAAMVLVGIFSNNFVNHANTILQTETAPEMRGRVMSLWTLAFLGTTPIGGPIIGWIGEHLGARWGLAVGGFAALAAAGLGALLMWKAKKRMVSERIRQIASEATTETSSLIKQ